MVYTYGIRPGFRVCTSQCSLGSQSCTTRVPIGFLLDRLHGEGSQSAAGIFYQSSGVGVGVGVIQLIERKH
jgi:hypothetical protein